jgi:quercetin 2,3-dioxygenase
MTCDVQRASARFVTHAAGWVGRYCFSYDEHYDPANVSFGRVLACNELVLEPGAGFGLHRHAGIDIVTTVLEGVLTHVTAGGAQERGPGSYVLATGPGVEHDERNDSAQPVRFVQTWLSPGTGSPLPSEVTGSAPLGDGRWFVFVADGEAHLDDVTLRIGDSARLRGPAALSAAGLALAWQA